MALGGVVAMRDRRFRLAAEDVAKVPGVVAGGKAGANP
jgi:hypothetical protein